MLLELLKFSSLNRLLIGQGTQKLKFGYVLCTILSGFLWFEDSRRQKINDQYFALPKKIHKID